MDNNARLELSIDLTNKTQVAAFANLFLALDGQTTTIVTEEETSKPVKKERAAKAKELPMAQPETKELPTAPPETPTASPEVSEKEAEDQAPKKDEPKVSVEDVRALLQTKVTEHRAAIKDKLTEFGAANVTALASEKYVDFINFLNALS